MPPGHVTTQDQAPSQGGSADLAAELDEALAPVHRVLRVRRIPCLRVALVSMELWGLRPSFPEYHMPALEVWGQGRIVAVITVGTHSRDFYVSLPAGQAEPQVVPAEFPERVVELIPGYRREAS